MIKTLMVLLALIISSAQAEPMHFEAVRNGGNCAGCGYIQATGKITRDTPTLFETFAHSQKFGAGLVRLSSPGGNLIGGILLGETFRSLKVSTEVGSSAALLNASEPGSLIGHPGFALQPAPIPFLEGLNDR